jgi:hypothetical protein
MMINLLIETKCLAFSESAIAEYIDWLERLLTGVPVKIILNIDETGFQPWDDERNISV